MFFHSSCEAPQLLWEKPKNRIAAAATHTAILCRSFERAIECPPSSFRVDFQQLDEFVFIP
jgi:hypothetical protein